MNHDEQRPLGAAHARPRWEEHLKHPDREAANVQVVPEDVRRLLNLDPAELPGAVHGLRVADETAEVPNRGGRLQRLREALFQRRGLLAQDRIGGPPEVRDQSLALHLADSCHVAAAIGRLRQLLDVGGVEGAGDSAEQGHGDVHGVGARQFVEEEGGTAVTQGPQVANKLLQEHPALREAVELAVLAELLAQALLDRQLHAAVELLVVVGLDAGRGEEVLQRPLTLIAVQLQGTVEVPAA
mmetsp:Transcript_62894/g.184426  ORF Transcript_62894/g.184426 Transcript_62894/m.184426 type:complete len:241 (+) Transcript_62894:458-1180(+)